MKTTIPLLLSVSAALLSPAKAAVVTTTFPTALILLTPSDSPFHGIDLDANGTADFTIWYTTTGSALLTDGANRAATIRYEGQPAGVMQLLSPGYLVGADLAASGLYDTNWESSKRPGDPLANFNISVVMNTGSGSLFPAGGGRAGIGVEFHAADGIHYGYLDLAGAKGFSGVELHGWAYETEPGVPIAVGSVPEPVGSALLVLTAGALLLPRRRLLGG